MTRGKSSIGVAGFALVLMAGCSAPQVPPPPNTSSSSAAPTTTPSPTPAAFNGDIRTLLLAVPDGAREMARPDVVNHAVDVDTAGAMWNESDPASAVAYYKQLGYQDGAEIAWQDQATGDRVAVQLLRFATENNATDWLTGIRRIAPQWTDYESSVDIPGIPFARAYTLTPYEGRSYMIGSLYKGTIGIYIRTNTAGTTANVALVEATAQQQFERLP